MEATLLVRRRSNSSLALKVPTRSRCHSVHIASLTPRLATHKRQGNEENRSRVSTFFVRSRASSMSSFSSGSSGSSSTISSLTSGYNTETFWNRYRRAPDTSVVIRKKNFKFQRINKEEEPPLRMLDHGLYGEYVSLSPEQKEPNPYVLRSGEKCYHAFRFDQDVCDEKAHDSEFLCSIHGDAFYDNQTSFRQILAYSGGVSAKSDVPTETRNKLLELLLPAALKIYGESDSAEAWEASEMFSIYTNLLIPGNAIKLHVDTPDFAGLDRSQCPSWLLAVAHCSGLFTEDRIRNVTCVCYPRDANGGELSLHAANKTGCVFPVRTGTAVVMNADSIFHQVAMVKPSEANKASRSQSTANQDLPAKCTLEVEERDDGFWWIIRDKTTGELATEVREDDIRFSVSCKFHIFHDKAEAGRMKSEERRLTAEHIIEVLTEDLKRKSMIPRTCERMKLFDLAPIMVTEYILPHAPASADIERVWKDYLNF